MGVTFTDPWANAGWVGDEGFQYEIWSDSDKDLAVYYGAASSSSAFFPDRVTRVLDAEGALILEYNSVDFNSTPAKVLDDCERIFGN